MVVVVVDSTDLITDGAVPVVIDGTGLVVGADVFIDSALYDGIVWKGDFASIQTVFPTIL